MRLKTLLLIVSVSHNTESEEKNNKEINKKLQIFQILQISLLFQQMSGIFISASVMPAW